MEISSSLQTPSNNVLASNFLHRVPMDRFQQPMSWKPDPEPELEFDGPEKTDWHAHYESFGGDDDSGRDDAGEFSIDDSARACFSETRNFFLPVHYTPSYKYPLIVWLHSNGYNENQIDHVMPYISTRNYIGVGVRANKAADSVGHRFDWHQSAFGIAATQESIVDSVEETIARFSVNTDRIILAGYREGGTMALRIAMREPNRFAGAISVGGRMPEGSLRNLNQLRERRMQMLWQWSERNADYTDSNFKSDCQGAMAAGCRVDVRQYPGHDEMDTVVLRDIDDWIMRQIVTSSTATADSDRWNSSPTAYSSN
jgi:phospholipase/carboxylesterase